MTTPKKPPTKPDQIWLVIYECRIESVRISSQNEGFFAAGQECLWDFHNVQKWLKCLYDPEIEELVLLNSVKTSEMAYQPCAASKDYTD